MPDIAELSTETIVFIVTFTIALFMLMDQMLEAKTQKGEQASLVLCGIAGLAIVASCFFGISSEKYFHYTLPILFVISLFGKYSSWPVEKKKKIAIYVLTFWIIGMYLVPIAVSLWEG